MDLTHFTFDVDSDGIATVLMDRAGEEMNTLSPETGEELAVILDDRNASVVSLAPVFAGVYIVDDELEAAAYKRQQLLNEDLAQVTTLATVYVDRLQQRFSMVGVKCRRQSAWRNRRTASGSS